MKRPVLILVLCLLMGGSALHASRGTLLLREPSISRSHIVFVHANDLWMVQRTGGDAWRLTSNEGAESLPHFSPDGGLVAFTAQYDGNTDVYVVPSEGGQPRRLTWHPGADNVRGWTPDGEYIVFTSGREAVPTRETKFFLVHKDGGSPEALPIPRAANGQLSPDGRYIAYQEVGFWDPEWRNYRAGQAKPIWIVNMNDFSLMTTPQTDGERHMSPVWLGNRVYFISERDYAANIWSYDIVSEQLSQETFHVDFDVKNINSGGGMIVYEQGGALHILDPDTRRNEQVVVHVRGDFHWSRPRWETVRPAALQNASLSPTGQRALFEYRGEIFTVPKEHGDARNITRSSGVADRFPVWSPDGERIAWFSDQEGEYQLVIGDQSGMGERTHIALPEPSFFFRPEWSPDGQYIAYTDTHLNLYWVELETGNVNLVDADRFVRPERTMNPVWSPDSRWIAYAQTQDNMYKAIILYNVDTGQRIQATDAMADAISPVWDASGDYLYFLASTDYGLNTGWLDMSAYDSPLTRSLYVMVLSSEGVSPFLPISDEENTSGESDIDNESSDLVRINEDGLMDRIVAVNIPSRNYAGLVAGPKGYVFYLENEAGRPGLSLKRYNLSKQESETFLSPVQGAVISHDRKSLLYRSGNTWGIVEAGGRTRSPGDGRLSAADNIQLRIDPEEEWKQIFREGWRLQRDFLYVDNVHGAPWDDIFEWYRPWVDHVKHRTDLNYVVEIMGGEVAIGHSYVRGGDMPSVDRVPVGLLGIDYTVDEGFYRIGKILDGSHWNPNLRAPLGAPGLGVAEGDYLLEVNGMPLDATQNLFQAFEGTANRQTILRVNDRPQMEGSRLVTVIPVASEAQLRQIDWIEGNRRKVDELSGGRLAYVYVPNTSGAGYQSFNRYYFAQQDKKGAIIDERNNGGGSAADYMIDIMSRELFGYFNSKSADRKPFTTPMAGIWGPKVMIINERAGSGGDLLPYMFRKQGIGPLIGTRTWGGLVGIWDTPPFIDGGSMMAPRGGFFDVDGQWAVEAEGVGPDIEVEQLPSLVILGRDPQLERAVEEALRLLETEAIELQGEPDPPIRYRRPDPR